MRNHEGVGMTFNVPGRARKCIYRYWHTPITLALKKQQQEDCTFKAILGYLTSSRPG